MKRTISGTYRNKHWHEEEYGQVEHGTKLTVAEKESANETGRSEKEASR